MIIVSKPEAIEEEEVTEGEVDKLKLMLVLEVREVGMDADV